MFENCRGTTEENTVNSYRTLRSVNRPRTPVCLTVALAALIAFVGLASSVGTNPVAADSQNPHLYGTIGGTLANPEIHNIFASPGGVDGWNSRNTSTFSEAAINQLTTKLLTDGYLDGAAQYGVGTGTLVQSTTNDGCYGAPSGDTSESDILAWITCEIQLPGTGIDWPGGNSLYIIYLQPSVNLNAGGASDCQGDTGYHSSGVVGTPLPTRFAYAVIPLRCVENELEGIDNFDGLSQIVSHELVEGVTDPILDLGYVDYTATDPFETGEAADICEKNAMYASQPNVYLSDGLSVSRYWSNEDNSCWPVPHTLTLNVTGTSSYPFIDVTNPSTNRHPYSTEATAGVPATVEVFGNMDVSWQFKSPMIIQGGVAEVTNNTALHTIHGMHQNWSDTANYYKADLLTVTAAPDGVTTADPSLEYTKWVADGDNIELTAPEIVPVASGLRYRFDSWSADNYSTDPTIDILMDQPKTATAHYVLQHYVKFDVQNLPARTSWAVTVNGVQHPGPYSDWFDVGSTVTFQFQSTISSRTDQGTRYTRDDSSPQSTLTVTTETSSMNASYKTQHQLTISTSGLPSPNQATISNNGTEIGQINDSNSLQPWIDDGASVDLAADPVVNGADGTQYFLEGISPTPPEELTSAFSTTLTYQTMNQIVGSAVKTGGISGPGSNGIANSFETQFDAVQRDMQNGNYASALADLTSFISHVDAQRGKKVKQATADQIELDALNVFHNALCLGSENLSPSQMLKQYDYYVKKVETIGGTVLPPCSAS